MMHTKQAQAPSAHHPAAESTDAHHGDLRKGAYLRRRADYQTQASSPYSSQAGVVTHKVSKAR